VILQSVYRMAGVRGRLVRMEFQEVVRRRRMVRRYDSQRAVPTEVVEELVHNALRAPSAGFSQGYGLLVLDEPEDIERFRTAVTPSEGAKDWFAANFEAPVVIIPCANKDAYLERYARPDKGFTDRSDAWWPAPYWDIDTGFTALLVLLTAVDRGLGACFFGLPIERVDAFRQAFGVPSHFRPIGAISIGYPAEPARDLGDRRRPEQELVHRGRWDA
jgi:nitroreductase